MTTYENVGAALADPKSNIARVVREYDTIHKPNRVQAIEALMAQGLTREQAYQRLLFA
jgi:hypothetical protein